MLIDCPRLAPILPGQNVFRPGLFLRMAASWKDRGEDPKTRKPESSEFALYGPPCLLRIVVKHTARGSFNPGCKQKGS
jgi:hypothetical protein